ncbi:MAG: TIGR01906 family membrane protein [Clostridia bacterium]|nr:TIGR01906 family membrane protein [Lachnospiraceae bacterium]NCB99071.1 TIGR01906 family membrane protein [Clostridia bacterium]NCD03495.1 TIGR01906 family membrane protein [Clostridia bacterium]
MHLKHFLTALALTLCIISASVVITLNFKPLYYIDMGIYNLSEETGYTDAEIRENYNALIEYNSVFYQGELNFPSLPMSKEAQIHFVEVKRIFVFIQAVLFPLSLIGSIIGIWYLKKKKQKPAYLKLTSVLSLALPAILGILIALNWDQFFVTFHEIFFNNDYWIFDASTDPIILLLPDGYFMHCALMILGLIILSSLLCFILYRKKSINSKNHS